MDVYEAGGISARAIMNICIIARKEDREEHASL